MKKLISADTVDVAGNVWETTGENIRKGEKEFSKNAIMSIADILFPVGSIYCGENEFILSVGKWKALSDGIGQFIQLGVKLSTGSIYTAKKYAEVPGETDNYAVLRMWQRTE